MDRTLIDIAKQVGVKVIATNDFHYLRREDAPVQDVIMCIGMNAKVDDPNRMRMTGSEFYMKTEEEMRAMFPYCPEACDNTLEIADKCYVELDWDSIILPRFPLLDPGETHESQFRRECEKGLRQHYGDDWATREIGGVNIKERFEYEYKVICDKGFAAYFLIVAEYVQWAKDNGIGVGPGRGSAAGAIVAYAMNITAFDPLENGLMFERFLSPQRTEMPDIDMDFDDERRLEVVEHVRQLYGPEKVTHVITYSTIKPSRPSTMPRAFWTTRSTWASACPRWSRATPRSSSSRYSKNNPAKRICLTPTLPRPIKRTTTPAASSTRRSRLRASPVARACTRAPF